VKVTETFGFRSFVIVAIAFCTVFNAVVYFSGERIMSAELKEDDIEAAIAW
jgi:hypothetical protein